MSNQNDNFRKAQHTWDSMTPPDERRIKCERCGMECYESDLADVTVESYGCVVKNICTYCVDEIVEFARRSK